MRKIAALIALLLILPACASSPESRTDGNDAGSGPSSSSPTEKDGSETRNPGGKSWNGPDFTVETFTGDTFTLADQAGTPVVLNFWESW